MHTPRKPNENARHPKIETSKHPKHGPSRPRDSESEQRNSDSNLDAAFAGKEFGEGNYKAAKQYDDATRDFVRSGQVEGAASGAAPQSSQQAKEMADAEAYGKRRSKGEDPALHRRSKKLVRGT